MKWITVLFAALTIGWLAWWGLGDPASNSEALANGANAEIAPSDTTDPLELDADLVGGDEVAPGRVVPDPVTNPDSEASDRAQCSGRVILVDDDGREHGDMSGALTYIGLMGGLGMQDTVKVTDGRFGFDPTGFESMTVQGLILEERRAVEETLGTTYSLDGSELVIRAKWAPMFTLNVLSSESGTDLDRVTVVTAESWWFQKVEHPATRLTDPDARLVTSGLSPLSIEPTADMLLTTKTTLFVHSPGHAWKAIQVDMSQGGEREVRLDSGGDVTFHVTGVLIPGTKLRFRTPGEPIDPMVLPRIEVPLGNSAIHTVAGLIPGPFVVTAEVGPSYASPVVLGTCHFEISAGNAVDVDLALEALPEIEDGVIAGTLHAPGAWGFTDFKVAAIPRDHPGLPDGHIAEVARIEMVAVPGVTDTWSYEFPPMPVGTYTLQFQSDLPRGSVSVPHQIELTSEGSHVHFAIPPPATIRLKVVDVMTGEPAELEGLLWGAADPATGVRFTYEVVYRDAGRDEYEFDVPLGRTQLRTMSGGYVPHEEYVEVGPGLNTFEFRVHQDCPLSIAMMDGETLIPFPSGQWIEPDHVDGDGKVVRTITSEAEYQAAFDFPGDYRIDFPEFDGFEPIPTQTVTLERGKATRLVVQLVKKL